MDPPRARLRPGCRSAHADRTRSARGRLADPSAAVGGPSRDLPDGVGRLRGGHPPPARLHGLVPARWHEARYEVGERRQHEQPPPGVAMRDLRATERLAGIASFVERRGGRGTIDSDPMAPEDEQIEVELPGSPAVTGPPPRLALQLLECGEQLDRADRGI